MRSLSFCPRGQLRFVSPGNQALGRDSCFWTGFPIRLAPTSVIGLSLGLRLSIWFLSVFFVGACRSVVGAEPPPTLTSLSPVTALPTSEGAKAMPVKAKGTVTFADGGRKLLYIQQDGFA